jgi:hypothetical protein
MLDRRTNRHVRMPQSRCSVMQEWTPNPILHLIFPAGDLHHNARSAERLEESCRAAMP